MKYSTQLARLRERKLAQTRAKLDRLGTQDEDDYGNILPPPDFAWQPPKTDGGGTFQGARAWAAVFRSLMEHHPVYIDADDALAGRWMFMLSRMRPQYRLDRAPFPFDYSHLEDEQRLYDITSGIGADAHFAPDYHIGLQLGWGGLKQKVRASLEKHAGDAEAVELLEAEIEIIEGVQNWIERTAAAGEEMARMETDPTRRENLAAMAAINRRLVVQPPSTLCEACQWLAWFNMASRTYNRDGAGGQLDELLRPYYEHDLAEGMIDDDDALYYIACLLLNDPHYYQIGGPDKTGRDQTTAISHLILEAAHLLKLSCNITIRVHDGLDEKLFRRGIDILFSDQLGYPRFSGDKALVAGFMKNGFDAGLARERIAVGCNWMSLPGREYTLNDVVKINIAKVFEVAFWEMLDNADAHSVENLFSLFSTHLRHAIHCTARGIDFHLAHQYKNEPELLLNLLCHGPIERGRDASHGGVDFYNMCIDGAGLATVADSFAALEQRIEDESRLGWQALAEALRKNFDTPDGEKIRLLLSGSDRFGRGLSRGDKWAARITNLFAASVKAEPAPVGRNLLPGWFSWADTVRFGKTVGATPNGRRAGAPISHGANPHPGFRKDGALTAIVKAVADVQPGYGNTAPLQLEVDPCSSHSPDAKIIVGNLIKTHFDLGGTLININIIDAEKIRDAHKHPEKYPDLVVRVTGFTAYFASLSKEFRQLVVDRIIQEQVC
ncbi:MAG: pyruvate formate lyase family protein [Opitutaceae bacterium]|jgi:formate C-acetyltransferase|nr:pyruvate formate lyase family protein [Opitutaceae bacterium]